MPHDRIRQVTEAHPQLTRLLWLSTTMGAAIHREWVLSLARRTAIGRIAHLFCERHVRLGIIGLVDDEGSRQIAGFTPDYLFVEKRAR